MLEMRPVCERCQAPLAADGAAFVCSYECTFCETCTGAMGATCPNCSGELLRRPARTKKSIAIVAEKTKAAAAHAG